MAEQALIARFKYGQHDLEPLFALEDRLSAAIELANVGEFDGNEIATDLSDGTLYMYGPDADALFTVVLPILKATAFLSGAEIVRRYGDAQDVSAREVRTTI